MCWMFTQNEWLSVFTRGCLEVSGPFFMFWSFSVCSGSDINWAYPDLNQDHG